jgi:tungstate transport system permease protein
MDLLTEGFKRAFLLILHLDAELVGIIFLSLKVSILALMKATAVGLPLGALPGLKRFPGKGPIISLMNAFMGLPPVVVGPFLYLLLSRSGPLGFIGLLYTPGAMVIAQTILAAPILTMKKGGRTTVIMSTHDREQAARLADTVVMMHEGRIVQQGM